MGAGLGGDWVASENRASAHSLALYWLIYLTVHWQRVRAEGILRRFSAAAITYFLGWLLSLQVNYSCQNFRSTVKIS
jgi:hypothetical protein